MTNNLLHEQPPISVPETAVLAAGSGESAVFTPAPFDSETNIYEGIDTSVNPLVAEISVADNHFAIFEDRNSTDPNVRYFVATTRFNPYAKREDGKRQFTVPAAYPIKTGEAFDFGRSALQEAGSMDVTNTMSRKQAEITVDAEGRFVVAQKSANVPTRVVFAEAQNPDAQAWEIDPDQTVPRGRLQGTLGRIGSAGATVEQVEVKETLEQLEARLDAERKQLEAPFGEDARLNLWRYATGRMMKRDAQADGDGGASIRYEQEAGQAYRALPEEAKKIASQYLHVMQQLDLVRDKIEERGQ